MNLVVAGITLRGMVGRKRALLLLALPLTLLVLAVTFRATGFDSPQDTAQLLQRFGLGTLLPLVALIAGTGVLSPEIDDGTIVFLLSKPVPRPAILHAKLAVAAGLTWLVVAVPMGISGLILAGTAHGLAAGFVVGTLAGALAYCAIFLLITVVSRHAVVLGLIYALVWESLIGGYVPGARELSVQQWSLTIAAAFTHGGLLQTSVGLPAAIGLLAAAAVLATILAGQRLRSLSIPGEV
ncbi:MAG: ABC transporter permease subunit [Candidatus Dormibacteraeota bacterium]|nr:ABC transporter permease subunit [Candidatus Dormibacteraeota bacterium]